MPEKSSRYGSNYRWTANDIIYPLCWSLISGSFSVIDITGGEGATLMNAVTLQVKFNCCPRS